MWYDKHRRFSIGAQFGGPNVGYIPQLKKELCELLNESCESTGSDTIDHIAIVLRIIGAITSFGEEGADRVRHQAKQRFVGADITIPESILECSLDRTREFLANAVRMAIAHCVERLQEKRLGIDDVELMGNVDFAISNWLSRNG